VLRVKGLRLGAIVAAVDGCFGAGDRGLNTALEVGATGEETALATGDLVEGVGLAGEVTDKGDQVPSGEDQEGPGTEAQEGSGGDGNHGEAGIDRGLA